MTASERIRAAREQRDALRLEGTISTFPGAAPQPTEGQIDLNGDVLRKPTDLQRRFWPPCCDKALVLAPQCVCAYMTTCPDHGIRHNGTHD